TDVTKVGPVNHLLHSMFNQIDVYFNQKLVSPPNNAYAYRAYIEALLNYASPAKTSHLTSCGTGPRTVSCSAQIRARTVSQPLQTWTGRSSEEKKMSKK
ncbi:hypothetical protein ALC57_18389, partial [Trachymyrmex cornetzi]